MDNIGFSEIYKNKRILKKHITVDSKERNKDIHSRNKSYSDPNDYVMSIDKYVRFKNVVSVRIIEAMIPNSQYVINENNKWLDIILPAGTTETNIELTPGNYSFSSLGAHLVTILGNAGHVFTVILDNTATRNTTITAASKFTLLFKTGQNAKCSIANVLGFKQEDKESISNVAVSDYAYHLNNSKYVDIQIDEIPDIGNTLDIKQDETRQILKRIPIDVDFGQEKFYFVTDSDRSYNYFTPIELSKLTIKFYNDLGYIYDSNRIDNYIILEISMLQDEAPDNMGFNPIPKKIEDRFVKVVDTNEEKKPDYYDIDIKNVVKTEINKYVNENMTINDNDTNTDIINNLSAIDESTNISSLPTNDESTNIGSLINDDNESTNIGSLINNDESTNIGSLINDDESANNDDMKENTVKENTVKDGKENTVIVLDVENIKKFLIENQLLVIFLVIFLLIILVIKKK
jgi:hypothetical protein